MSGRKNIRAAFYDICKEIEVGTSGGKAIDFIGGRAKNYSQFTKFLGDVNLLEVPFQINFLEEPRYKDQAMMVYLDLKPHACNDSDPAFRCLCVDCPPVCMTLPADRIR